MGSSSNWGETHFHQDSDGQVVSKSRNLNIDPHDSRRSFKLCPPKDLDPNQMLEHSRISDTIVRTWKSGPLEIMFDEIARCQKAYMVTLDASTSRIHAKHGRVRNILQETDSARNHGKLNIVESSTGRVYMYEMDAECNETTCTISFDRFHEDSKIMTRKCCKIQTKKLPECHHKSSN